METLTTPRGFWKVALTQIFVTAGGRTGLHLAAARGNVDICQLLHKFGADLLATDYQGNTALHLCGHVDTIQFLVSNGLKIDIW